MPVRGEGKDTGECRAPEILRSDPHATQDHACCCCEVGGEGDGVEGALEKFKVFCHAGFGMFLGSWGMFLVVVLFVSNHFSNKLLAL